MKLWVLNIMGVWDQYTHPVKVYADDVVFAKDIFGGVTKTVRLLKKVTETKTVGMLWWKAEKEIITWKVIGKYSECRSFYEANS